MIYLHIFDDSFDICRSLVQLLLMGSQVFSEVGRIQQAVGWRGRKYLYQIYWLTTSNCESLVVNDQNNYFLSLPKTDAKSKNDCIFWVDTKIICYSGYGTFSSIYKIQYALKFKLEIICVEYSPKSHNS